MLKRDEVKQKLIEWGIAEPTDEMVSDFLATNSKEIKLAEDKAIRYKAESDRVKELEKQLDAINNEKLTDAEKSQKAIEDANKRVMELEATVTSMKLQKELAEIGITGDDADGLFNEDGSLNVAKMGDIIKGREKTAVANFEKDALLKTPNPEGGKPEEEEIKPEVEYAKDYVARATAKADAHSIVDNYA